MLLIIALSLSFTFSIIAAVIFNVVTASGRDSLKWQRKALDTYLAASDKAGNDDERVNAWKVYQCTIAEYRKVGLIRD